LYDPASKKVIVCRDVIFWCAYVPHEQNPNDIITFDAEDIVNEAEPSIAEDTSGDYEVTAICNLHE
ncbi:unnamed protein product, partial [Ceratitis capitata]